MDKRLLIDQIRAQLQQSARTAIAAGEDAAQEAKFGATPCEKRQDARVAIEYSNMARAQSRRAMAAQSELAAIDAFRPGASAAPARIEVGSIVEVEDEDNGEGRTFFLAPAGAGLTLTGPGGDGLISVVTPASPIGKAVLGRRAGETVDVTVKGQVREWTITYVG